MKENTYLKNEWCKHFSLTARTQSKFYKIVGCYVLGFELIKIPHMGVVHPHLVVYPLWKEDIKECLKSPCWMYALLDRKGLQVQWPIEKLLEKREDVFSLFEEYIGFDIRKDIQSRDMANLIEKCEPCEYKDPWRLMSVAESRIYQSIYLGDKNMFHSSIENLDQTHNLIQPYLEIVESIYGKFDQRKEFWESQFGERDAVIKKVMENVANSKIKASVRLY